MLAVKSRGLRPPSRGPSRNWVGALSGEPSKWVDMELPVNDVQSPSSTSQVSSASCCWSLLFPRKPPFMSSRPVRSFSAFWGIRKVRGWETRSEADPHLEGEAGHLRPRVGVPLRRGRLRTSVVRRSSGFGAEQPRSACDGFVSPVFLAQRPRSACDGSSFHRAKSGEERRCELLQAVILSTQKRTWNLKWTR